MANVAHVIDEIDKTAFTTSIKIHCIDDCRLHLGDMGGQYSVVVQNIRSIKKNFDNFLILLNRLHFSPDIIILTECWLDDTYTGSEINNYDYHCSKHYLNQNDGIIVYTKSSLQASVIEPTCRDSNCLVVNVGIDLSLIAIYRSPSFHNISNFCESLTKLMESCKATTCAIVGDLNINIKSDNTDRRTTEYLDLTGHYGFFPGHTLPTRGDNCLDHVMLKTHKPATVAVCDSGITDHETVIVGIHKEITRTRVEKRHARIDYIKLKKDVQSESWDWLLNESNVTTAFQKFTETITSKIKQHTSNHVYRSSDDIIKPWITKNLLKCIRRRDLMHINAKKKENRDNLVIQQEYKKYRNYCNNILTNLKLDYERKLLMESKGDCKKLWNEIKKICNIKNKKTGKAELLTDTKNPVSTLNNVNEYFSTVGQSLAAKTLSQLGLTEIELARNNEQFSTVNHGSNSFFLAPTDESEIFSIISHLKAASATGYDGISNILLKQCSHELVRPIAFLCNLSLTTGIVPDCAKVANICPIFKSGDPKLPCNYRPISLMTALSKILEKVVNKRLLAYLEKNRLLSDNQYGFRVGRSTEDAVTNLANFISLNLDRGHACTGIFLDLAKAFDTISRKLLIKKMSLLGVRGVALDWFTSYLSDRNQKVILGEYSSDAKTVHFGVPQGSVLGPTLFIIYINGLCTMKIPQAKIFTYADDTAIVFYGETWDDVQFSAESGIKAVANWLQHNLLTLNVDKTKSINFAISKRTSPTSVDCLQLHSCSNAVNCTYPYIEQTDTIKYLGVLVDNRLTWSSHLSALRGRVRKMLRIFKQLGKIADDSILKMIYYSLCQSILNYCIIAWGAAGKTSLIKVERAQRALLKVAYRRPFRYPTDTLYTEVGVLRVRQLYILSVTLRFHKTSLNTCILSSRRVHWDKVRCRKTIGRRSYGFMGPHIYTKLNDRHKIMQLTLNKCKTVVTKWLSTLDYELTENFLA